jgi:hypothetical protein
MDEPFDCFDAGFEPLEDAMSQIDNDINKLVTSESVLDGGHAAADLLEGIGGILNATEEFCVDGLAEKVIAESLPQDAGPVSELAAELVLEAVEFISEASLEFSTPLLGAVGDAHIEIGQAVDNLLDAFEHAASGDFGEAGSELAEIADMVPDLSRDVAEGVVQGVAGSLGEVLEFGAEVGGILADFDPNTEAKKQGGLSDE